MRSFVILSILVIAALVSTGGGRVTAMGFSGRIQTTTGETKQQSNL